MSKWKDEENIVNMHNGILLVSKGEWNVICI